MSTEDFVIDPATCAEELERLVREQGIDPAATTGWPVWRTFLAYLDHPIDADHDNAACTSSPDPTHPGMHRLCLHRVLMRGEHGRQVHWGVRCRLLCPAPPGWRAGSWRITSLGYLSLEDFAAAVEDRPDVPVLFTLPFWRLDIRAGSPPPDW